MTTQNYGIPISNSKPGIVMPWKAFRFRIWGCPEGVTTNSQNVDIDFANCKIKLNVRATILPQDFLDVMRFSSLCNFEIDAMDGGNDGVFFSLVPTALKLLSHTMSLDYGVSTPAMHVFEFSFHDIAVRTREVKVEEPVAPAPKVKIDDDGFVTPEDALKAYVEQNSRIVKGLTNGRQLLNEVPTDPKKAG